MRTTIALAAVATCLAGCTNSGGPQQVARVAALTSAVTEVSLISQGAADRWDELIDVLALYLRLDPPYLPGDVAAYLAAFLDDLSARLAQGESLTIEEVVADVLRGIADRLEGTR